MTPERKAEIELEIEAHKQSHIECGDAHKCCGGFDIVEELLHEQTNGGTNDENP